MFLFFACSFHIELQTNMLPGLGDLDVLHHGVNALQNAVDFGADDVGAAARHFVGVDQPA